MQVFAHIALKSMRSVRGQRQSIYHSGWFNVVRLKGPVRESWQPGTRGRGYIDADIEIPDDLREHISVIYNDDGTVTVEVWVNTHRKTLAAFLASGDAEWNVKEMGL